MTSPHSGYESLIDQQIRMAQERGDFDDLPGTGMPLPGRPARAALRPADADAVVARWRAERSG